MSIEEKIAIIISIISIILGIITAYENHKFVKERHFQKLKRCLRGNIFNFLKTVRKFNFAILN